MQRPSRNYLGTSGLMKPISRILTASKRWTRDDQLGPIMNLLAKAAGRALMFLMIDLNLFHG
jgi:hypothetical protein